MISMILIQFKTFSPTITDFIISDFITMMALANICLGYHTFENKGWQRDP